MNPISRFIKKLSILFGGGRFANELDEEMAFHRAQVEEELIVGGMTPEAARYAAMRQFGNTSKLREQSHEVVSFRAETVVQDLRFALRQWTKNPGFALTAILILAMGTGVSVAIFGFVDAALLQPLPYANPERLMVVNESNVASPSWPLSYPQYLDWQRLNKSFSSLDVYSGSGYLLRTPSGALPVQGERVSGGFFKTLGVRPMLGRDFYPGENRPAGANVVLLSYGAWLHRFGGRRDVVGQTVDLDNASYTIMGGAGLLLLIACVNVASLVLVRSENRRREIAVRGALGATPARLVCQFVTESLLLAGFGSLTGALVAAGLMKLFARLVPKDMAANMPFLGGVALNAHTGAVTAAIALMAALLLAATPTLRLSFQKVRDGLAEGDRGHASRLWQRLGANMVIVELVVAVVLLAGAGLLGQSLNQLLHVPLGFDPNRLATVQVMASDRVY